MYFLKAPTAWGIVITSGAATVDERLSFKDWDLEGGIRCLNGCQAAAAEPESEYHFASIGKT